MALSPARGDREHDKFTLNSDGETAIRTVAETELTGEISISGLSEAIRTTTMLVTDVATPLPAVALANRNAMMIQNKSPTETLYIGNSNVTADTVLGTTSGSEIGPLESQNMDIKPDIVLYARAETGKTILIKVTELA
jgi:hypothetical protein